MPPPLDAVASAWSRLGAGLSDRPARAAVADVEALVVATGAVARADARVFWTAAAWLAVHHALVDGRNLARHLHALAARGAAGAAPGGAPESVVPGAREVGAVVGALCSAALALEPGASALAAAVRHARPLARPADRALFHVADAHPVLRAIAAEDARPEFARWGFWCNDLTDARDAVRPIAWALEACPELVPRAVLGPGLDSRVVLEVLAHEDPTYTGATVPAHGGGGADAWQRAAGPPGAPLTVMAIARAAGAAYAAVHAAADRLVGRGWLTRGSAGAGRPVALRPGPLARSAARMPTHASAPAAA